MPSYKEGSLIVKELNVASKDNLFMCEPFSLIKIITQRTTARQLPGGVLIPTAFEHCMFSYWCLAVSSGTHTTVNYI